MHPKGKPGQSHFELALHHRASRQKLWIAGGNEWKGGVLVWWANVHLPDGGVRRIGGLISDLAGRNESSAIEEDLSAKFQAQSF